MSLDQPLAGAIVIDATRMLPGAVLARLLADLGARIIKVEEPGVGDPMRAVPPLVDGTGAAFHAFYHGADSVALDLASPGGAAALRRLARHADVLVESFRPGTMERWGVGHERLTSINPVLVTCSLSAFGSSDAERARVAAHDLNAAAFSGVLDLLPGVEVAGVQLADVSAGLLAGASILAALVARHRTHRGARIEQPLATAPLPFLAWAWSARAAGGSALFPPVSGAAPAYRLYPCADGARIALGALEPKFWIELLEVVGLPELAGDALDTGERGAHAAARLAAKLAERPRAHWLALAAERGLPITAVHDVDGAMREPYFASRLRGVPVGGGALPAAPPFLDVAATAARCTPALGEGTARILAEFGAAAEEIAAAEA